MTLTAETIEGLIASKIPDASELPEIIQLIQKRWVELSPTDRGEVMALSAQTTRNFVVRSGGELDFDRATEPKFISIIENPQGLYNSLRRYGEKY